MYQNPSDDKVVQTFYGDLFSYDSSYNEYLNYIEQCEYEYQLNGFGPLGK